MPIPRIFAANAVAIRPPISRVRSRKKVVSIASQRVGKKLDAFSMQQQEQSNWCWAAVATTVSNYYGEVGNVKYGWKQCILAQELLGCQCCIAFEKCKNDPRCNSVGYLDKALDRVGHFAAFGGTTTFGKIQAQIDGARPVGIRVAWGSGFGHFIAIAGYETTDGVDWVWVQDPTDGRAMWPFNRFAQSYGFRDKSGRIIQTATWTHTYYTKP